MTIYLLDTNVVSDLVRNPQGRIAERIAAVGERQICTSIIVAAELRFGAAKQRSPRLTAQVDAVLSRLEIVPLDEPTDATYAVIRTALEAAGTPIGANDLLIAAQTLAFGYVLVTDNVTEFARVGGLSHENWLSAAV